MGSIRQLHPVLVLDFAPPARSLCWPLQSFVFSGLGGVLNGGLQSVLKPHSEVCNPVCSWFIETLQYAALSGAKTPTG
jgi:hypothetical protein